MLPCVVISDIIDQLIRLILFGLKVLSIQDLMFCALNGTVASFVMLDFHLTRIPEIYDTPLGLIQPCAGCSMRHVISNMLSHVFSVFFRPGITLWDSQSKPAIKPVLRCSVYP